MKNFQMKQLKDTVIDRSLDFLFMVEKTYKFYFVSINTKLLIAYEF